MCSTHHPSPARSVKQGSAWHPPAVQRSGFTVHPLASPVCFHYRNTQLYPNATPEPDKSLAPVISWGLLPQRGKLGGCHEAQRLTGVPYTARRPLSAPYCTTSPKHTRVGCCANA